MHFIFLEKKKGLVVQPWLAWIHYVDMAGLEFRDSPAKQDMLILSKCLLWVSRSFNELPA